MRYSKKDEKPVSAGSAAVYLLPAILTVIHILLVYKRDRVTFHVPDEPGLIVYVLIFFAVLTAFGFYTLLLRAVTGLLKGDKELRYRFTFFCAYFVFLSVFWILTWPGIFKGDEFYVLKAALSFELSAMQSGITSVFYIISLLFFPSMATIVFFQLLVICAVFSLVAGDLFKVFSGWRRLIVMIPFVLFPVIDAALFTLRASLCGWLFLFMLFCLYRYAEQRDGRAFFYMMPAAAGLLCAWRAEFIYLLPCLPLAMLILRKDKKKNALAALAIMILSWQLFSVPNRIASAGENKYPISLVLNPVANLFTEAEDLKGPAVYDDIMTINRVVDAALLRKNASVRNISQYWNIPSVLDRELLEGFMKASLRLIIYNPGKFLKYRVQTFLYTNGFYDGYTNHPGGEDLDAINRLVYYGEDYGSYFAFSRPFLGDGIRQKVISLLACRVYEKGNIHNRLLLPVLYDVLPLCILMPLVTVFSLIRKRRIMAVLSLLTFIQVPLVFLTAPAMFFMYYFCFYLCAGVITAVFIASILSNGPEKWKSS